MLSDMMNQELVSFLEELKKRDEERDARDQQRAQLEAQRAARDEQRAQLAEQHTQQEAQRNSERDLLTGLFCCFFYLLTLLLPPESITMRLNNAAVAMSGGEMGYRVRRHGQVLEAHLVVPPAAPSSNTLQPAPATSSDPSNVGSNTA